jgi:hypothetical protein
MFHRTYSRYMFSGISLSIYICSVGLVELYSAHFRIASSINFVVIDKKKNREKKKEKSSVDLSLMFLPKP